MDKLVEKYGSMENYYEVFEISCRVKPNRSIYLSAEGLVPVVGQQVECINGGIKIPR